jgi:hypothetical protein
MAKYFEATIKMIEKKAKGNLDSPMELSSEDDGKMVNYRVDHKLPKIVQPQ